MKSKNIINFITSITFLLCFPPLILANTVTMDDKSTSYSFNSSFGQTINDYITGLPLFDERLGTLSSVSISSQGLVSLDSGIFRLNSKVKTGLLGITSFQLDLGLDSYIKTLTPETFLTKTNAICPPSQAGFCAPGKYPILNASKEFAFNTSASGSNIQINTTKIPILAKSFYNGVGAVSGATSITGSLLTSRKYEPFSTSAYISYATKTNENLDSLKQVENAISSVIELRRLDGGTGSQNLNLRDAEYALLGFRSGAQLANFKDILQAVAVGSPISAVGFNTFKECSLNSKVCGAVWTEIFKAPPGQTTELPASPTGGGIANYKGFKYGLTNSDNLNGLGNALNNNIENITSTLTNPLMPTQTLKIDTENGINLNLFFVPPSNELPIYLDPVNSKSFSFFVYDNAFTDFQLPSILGKQDIKDAILNVNGNSRSIKGGNWYNFAELFGIKPNSFSLTNATGLLDDSPVFGIKLSNPEFAIIGEISSPTEYASPVPEPNTYALMFIGLIILVTVRMHRANPINMFSS